MDTARAGGAGLGLALLSAATFGTSGAFAAQPARRRLDAGLGRPRPRRARGARAHRPGAAALRGRSAQLRARRRHAGRVRRRSPSRARSSATSTPSQHLSVARRPAARVLRRPARGRLALAARTASARGGSPSPARPVAVAGLALVLDLLGGAGLDPVGVLWGLGAAVGLADVLRAVGRRPRTRCRRWSSPGAGSRSAASCCSRRGRRGCCRCAAPARRRRPARRAQVSWLVPVLGLSLVAAVVAYVTGIVGARLLGAKLASFVGLTEVLFAVLVRLAAARPGARRPCSCSAARSSSAASPWSALDELRGEVGPPSARRRPPPQRRPPRTAA